MATSKQTDIHTTSANAVTLVGARSGSPQLVWGSLRVAMIIIANNDFLHLHTAQNPVSILGVCLRVAVIKNSPFCPPAGFSEQVLRWGKRRLTNYCDEQYSPSLAKEQKYTCGRLLLKPLITIIVDCCLLVRYTVK